VGIAQKKNDRSANRSDDKMSFSFDFEDVPLSQQDRQYPL
jgi:hypothetical protein